MRSQASCWRVAHRVTKGFLLLSACSLPHAAPTAQTACYTFYSHDPSARGPLCPAECPVHIQCKDDSRTSCTAGGDCKYLLPQGVQVNISWAEAEDLLSRASSRVSYQACVSCQIDGCLECGGGSNGEIVCTRCAIHFESDGEGGCTWVAETFDLVVYVFIGVVTVIAIWVISDLIRADCAPFRNWEALKRGLVERRRAQLFMARSGKDADQLQRYPLSTNLHNLASASLMGPGLTLFMNWFIYMGCVSAWLSLGAVIYSLDEADLDPCLQQERIHSGWEFRSDTPLLDERTSGLKWATWNYLGVLCISLLFLYLQQYLWNRMIQDSRHPSLREYCVMLSGVPPEVTDKARIRKSLGDWMSKLHLDRDGIKSISIAYDIPHNKSRFLEEQAERLLSSVAASQTSACLPGGSNVDFEGTPLGCLFWVQFLAMFLFQLPFKPSSQARVSPEAGKSREVKDVLIGLRGSGCVFVVMNTEALARAVAGMAVVNLEGLAGLGKTPVTVCKALAEPQMICWENFGKIPVALRIFRWVRTIVVLILALFIWLMLFASFLSFELATKGHPGVSKAIAGIFVGMLVPIGNAMMGGIVDLLMRNFGFRDEDDLASWRQILSVAVNGCANIGEIYLVFKKTLLISEWLPEDFFINLTQVFRPLGANPSAFEFQGELKAILFPMGMLVPIVTIPLLADTTPWLIGRLRVKGDPSLNGLDAERIMRPNDVDFMGPYTDMIINFFILAFASWISPGKYLATLWITMCIWLLLLYLNMRLNVLRWQAVTYFGGKKTHHCSALLLAVPIGMLAAAFDHQIYPSCHYGVLGLCLHILFHGVFVQYVLHALEPPRASFGTTLLEMMMDKRAPLANYENTNPVEVLRRHYTSELEADPTPLVFFRNHKWYLQKRTAGPGDARYSFTGEENVGVWSLRRGSKDQGKQDPKVATYGPSTNPFSADDAEVAGPSTNPFSPKGPSPGTKSIYDPLAGGVALRSRLEHLSERHRTSSKGSIEKAISMPK